VLKKGMIKTSCMFLGELSKRMKKPAFGTFTVLRRAFKNIKSRLARISQRGNRLTKSYSRKGTAFSH